MQFNDLVTATRPVNSILTAVAVFVGASIAASSIVFSPAIGTAMLVGFLICAAGVMINDFFDFETDLKKGKNRFVSITNKNKRELLEISLVLFIIGNALAFFINPIAFGIALVISLLLILYSAVFPRYKIIGNVIVALGTALPLVFGAAVFERFNIVVLLAASAFFANWAREIVKDVQDRESDAGFKTTLPMVLKMSQVDVIVGVVLALAVAFSYAPVLWNVFGNSYYLILVSIANALFVKAFVEFRGFKTERSQQTFKIAMVVALTGFLAGVL